MEPQSRNDVINKQLHYKYETALQLCNRTTIMQLHCNYATALQLCNRTRIMQLHCNYATALQLCNYTAIMQPHYKIRNLCLRAVCHKLLKAEMNDLVSLWLGIRGWLTPLFPTSEKLHSFNTF